MMQNQIDRDVARATGESLSIIRSIGFSIADPDNISFDPERSPHGPKSVDWDRLDAKRGAYLSQRSRCQ